MRQYIGPFVKLFWRIGPLTICHAFESRDIENYILEARLRGERGTTKLRALQEVTK